MKEFKILLVDDELPRIEGLIEYLNMFFIVESTDDPYKVLDLIEVNEYDAFLIDMNMPKINGIKLCKKINENDKFLNVPKIFVTAISDIMKIKEAFDVGATDYILKPIVFEEVHMRLENHIKNSLKYFNSLKKQLELNNQIENLTKELLELKDSKQNEENKFKDREDNFSLTNKRLEENKKTSISFQEKIYKIQKKLQIQKEFLEKTKKLLN